MILTLVVSWSDKYWIWGSGCGVWHTGKEEHFTHTGSGAESWWKSRSQSGKGVMRAFHRGKISWAEGMAYVTSLFPDSVLISSFSIFAGSLSSCSLNVIIIKMVTLMKYLFCNLHAFYHLIIKPLICWANVDHLPHIAFGFIIEKWKDTG